MAKKKTLGAIASELQTKTPDTLDPIEIQRATQQEYLDNLIWCVKHAQKKLDCSNIDGHDACKNRPAMDGDFFIAALLKKEKLLENVLRNYFVPTLACPTPHFDQTVFKYNAEKEDVEFLWVVPDQETCEIFRENKDKIVPEERGLLKFVLDYYDGTLFNKAKKLNGESHFAGSALEKGM
jgi:hypothetical protein